MNDTAITDTTAGTSEVNIGDKIAITFPGEKKTFFYRVLSLILILVFPGRLSRSVKSFIEYDPDVRKVCTVTKCTATAITVDDGE